MNMMIFPRMFASHREGWDWLMRLHPSAVKMYLVYVVPLSLIPPAMLLYAWSTNRDSLPGNIEMNEALALAVLFYVMELVMVPVMGRVIQRIGEVIGVRADFRETFGLAAVVATPLWLAPLFLFIPSLTVNVLAVAAALFGSGMLIYEGTYRVFQLEEEGRSLLLAGSILAAGLVAWVAMMVIALVSWGWAAA
jgi:hypothetical protein